MNGINATTGKLLSGLDHLRQSIADILSTPIGSRVMRRDYGSNLYLLIDHPMDGALKMEIYSSVIDALEKWEPRLKVNSMAMENHGWITMNAIVDLKILSKFFKKCGQKKRRIIEVIFTD